MCNEARRTNICLYSIKLELVVFEDGSFKLMNNGKELSYFIDDNDLFIYYIKSDSETYHYFFKHDLAKIYLIDGKGDKIIYKDNNYRNVNLNNLKKCSYDEYREIMVDRSRKIDKLKEDKKIDKNRTTDLDRTLIDDETNVFHQIILPSGVKKGLNKNIPMVEKINSVEELTVEWIDAIHSNWNGNNVRFFLDGLANYLVWHKEEEDKNKEDKEILSIKKIEEMSGERKAKSTPFTSLTKAQKENIGL